MRPWPSSDRPLRAELRRDRGERGAPGSPAERPATACAVPAYARPPYATPLLKSALRCCQFAPAPIEKASVTWKAIVGFTLIACTFDFVAWKRPIHGSSQLVSRPNGAFTPTPIQTFFATWPER